VPVVRICGSRCAGRRWRRSVRTSG
jgi:hypothetical protein